MKTQVDTPLLRGVVWHSACCYPGVRCFMRCIVHIRKSFDTTGKHFALRLLPLCSSDGYSSENVRKVETFTGEGALSQRLIGMGLPQVYMDRSFSNLRAGLEEGGVGRGLLQVGDFGGGLAGARVVGGGAHLDAEVGRGPVLSNRGHVAIIAFVPGGYGAGVAIAFDMDAGDGLGWERFVLIWEVVPG